MAPPTYYVVCLHEKCSQEAADYIAECLTRKAIIGGSELIVSQEESMRKNGAILHISASNQRLLEIAEDIGLKKKDNNDVIREFKASYSHEFPESGLVGPLTLADVQRCVLHAMESLHFDPDKERHLPGHEDYKTMRGAPILSAYREKGFVDTFPLHDDETLERLHKKWKHGNVFDPPIEEIRDYFGENVALYFSFTTFYTWFLIPIAGLGILQLVLDKVFGWDILFGNVLFACLNLIAVTVFLEVWKRKSNEHNYNWGTGGKLRHKPPRPEFRGEIGKNKITGKDEMQYPKEQTIKKVVFVSLPITLGCLIFAFCAMLFSFTADRWVYHWALDEESNSVPLFYKPLTFLPSILYSVFIMMGNQYYLHLAHYLSEWENHRTQEQFERHVVSKLVLFEFVNTFLALFYIAFYMQDIYMLKNQVFMMLITHQIISQLQETILPIFLKRPSTRRVINKVSRKMVTNPNAKFNCKHSEIETLPLRCDESHVESANFSLSRSPYESTYGDFMEIWLQFGHVFLFSSVYPLAAFFALLNNLLELKVDAYKLCRLTRKPTPRAVRDIGAWYMAFAVTSVFSVMTNLALIAMDPGIQSLYPDTTVQNWILAFVALEHIFLLIRVGIDKLISDVPRHIKYAMDRDDYLKRTAKMK